MTIEKIVEHWIKTSDQDFITMVHLFQTKDYHWSLFLGHLVIEKLLKAFYVKNKDRNVPLTHNLVLLSKKAELDLSNEDLEFLADMTTFNIRSRYDDYKEQFRQKCDENFAQVYVNKVKGFRLWIKSLIKE